MEKLRDLPTGLLIALGALVLVQLSLQVWGLLDLSRREVVPGGRKWVWAVVILFGNLLGAIVYLVVGQARRCRRRSRISPAAIAAGNAAPRWTACTAIRDA
ncbi:MAG: PLDc_N domain-containing protein [Gemmatimonadetes bacterium]|nr:PLDc_N domain-containing protein [Gemmatimonadota bacterium]